uniref:Uncharacterized protein n=1 Tax=Anguilla anguilla TaxID=7936 RepID=A0A0E9WPN0_ANGAN
MKCAQAVLTSRGGTFDPDVLRGQSGGVSLKESGPPLAFS